MDTLGVVKDEIVSKLLVKESFVTDEVKVVIDELLLESSTIREQSSDNRGKISSNSPTLPERNRNLMDGFITTVQGEP